MADLTDSLKYCAEPFISYLEIKQVISMEDRQIATSELTAERQILVVLKMLQQKDAGWEYLIEFLNNDHRSRLANALQTAAGESVLSPNLQTHSEEETPFIISETRVDLEDSIRSRTNDPAPVEVILIRDGEESAEIHEPSSEVILYLLIKQNTTDSDFK